MLEQKPNIHLVEDDARFRQLMVRSFGKDFRIVQAPSLKTAVIALDNGHYDLVLMDLSFDDDELLEGLQHIKPFKKIIPDTPIIVVTKDQSSSTTVEAIKVGADDFLRKDEFHIQRWIKVFKKWIDQPPLAVDASAQKKTTRSSDTHTFIGESPQIQQIKKYLVKLSSKPDYTVLLLGETGVGKEVAARYLHEQGVRSDKPFQAINLSAVSKTLMESSLFGHKKGAFTDAKSDQKGAFEKAHGGVLFLDEIGEIDMDIQIKLLRFLQDKTITPVGGKNIELDVQIVAATNRNLEKAIEERNFREDLYYRLSSFKVEIPPLRERPRDIKLLVDFYTQKFTGVPSILTPRTEAMLLNYHWPGNIRQLVNIMRTISVYREFDELEVIDVDRLPKEVYTSHSGSGETKGAMVKEQAAMIELNAIEEALQKHSRKTDAAKALDLSLDQLKYRVDKHFQDSPNLLERYTTIVKKYNLSNTK